MAKVVFKKPVLQDKNPVSVKVDGVQLNAKKFTGMPQEKALARIVEISGKDITWAKTALQACKEAINPPAKTEEKK